MPITGVNSYPPTAQVFSYHWQTVNDWLPSGQSLVLPDGTTRDTFVLRLEQMNGAFAAIPFATGAERTASADLKMKREALQPRMVQFRQSISLYLSKTRFANAAPKVPGPTEGEQIFKTVGETILARWAEINAATDLAPFTPPLMLPPPGSGADLLYSRSDFETEWQALMAAFSADHLAGEEATQKRANRNALLPQMYGMMKDYRATCQLRLPKGSPLLVTLPRLTPLPGTTPPALTVAGAWDNPLNKARLTWPASSAPNIDKLQVRACRGGTYRADDEEIVADLPADATHYETDWGLSTPGAIATFKVYVMATTGNENGGKAVKIVRPAT